MIPTEKNALGHLATVSLFRSSLLTIVLVVVQSVSGAAQVGKLLPSDEAINDPEFFSFRAQLQAAVARRDAAAVLEVVAADIKNSFGGSYGKDDFRTRWRLSSAESELWAELGTVLALGGTFEGKDAFAAPYIWDRWPDEFDPVEFLVVIGTEVRVRAEPRLGGRVLTTLSFDIVKRSEDGQAKIGYDSGWTAVGLRDGRVGYVASRYIRSPIDYRAGFLRKDGGWWLTFFIAGD